MARTTTYKPMQGLTGAAKWSRSNQLAGMGPRERAVAISGGTYSTGGGGGSRGGGLANQFQSAMNRANRANERRYSGILKGLNKRRTDALGQLEGLGDQELSDVRSRYVAQQGNAQQNLVNRGLAGTTIAPTMRQGIARQETQDLSRVNDMIRQRQIGLDADLSGDIYSFMERRNDVGPDYGQLAQLAQGMGAAGYGGGGLGGGGPQYFIPQGLPGGGQFNGRGQMMQQMGGQQQFNERQKMMANQNRFNQLAPGLAKSYGMTRDERTARNRAATNQRQSRADALRAMNQRQSAWPRWAGIS